MVSKQIAFQREIDELREGEVVSIHNIASRARYCGIRDNMRVFSYRAGDRICELWTERSDLSPGNDSKTLGQIVLNTLHGPYEPITYRLEDNEALFKSKDSELRGIGL
jgi:hypothetical protein